MVKKAGVPSCCLKSTWHKDSIPKTKQKSLINKRKQVLTYLNPFWSLEFNMGDVTLNEKLETNLQFSVERAIRILFKNLGALTPRNKAVVQVYS